ncbi:MAG: hypothetical protein NZ826_02260 [Thermodesulfovibrio sp.]|nr:hypothetical protein [Thermodesulfovibrio sp.]MDW7972435.1 hypothetical protein [Thermodesulfovibrio sp.]
MYKESKSYKGFEKWWHEIQMSAKMHIYTFIAILFLHMMIPFLYLVLFDFKTIDLVLQAIFNFYVHLWPKALLLLFKKGFIIFILATPVWLLYPVLLRRYKKKSQQIMQDQHLRGSKLISDDELREIILKDIKQRRF